MSGQREPRKNKHRRHTSQTYTRHLIDFERTLNIISARRCQGKRHPEQPTCCYITAQNTI